MTVHEIYLLDALLSEQPDDERDDPALALASADLCHDLLGLVFVADKKLRRGHRHRFLVVILFPACKKMSDE